MRTMLPGASVPQTFYPRKTFSIDLALVSGGPDARARVIVRASQGQAVRWFIGEQPTHVIIDKRVGVNLEIIEQETALQIVRRVVAWPGQWTALLAVPDTAPEAA